MSSESTHILGNFQSSIDSLNADLTRMAGLVERNFDAVLRGLVGRDSKICAEIIADDEEIDQLEKTIDEGGLKIIALYQPVASDLRSVLSTMKVSSNLERVADQAVGIAKRARKMNKNPDLSETRLIEPLHQTAASLLRRALEAYKKGDVETALEVKRLDGELDRAYKDLAKKLTKRMEEDSSRIKDYLDLQFIARFLERVGDHAKNICEDTVFAESAVDIRHGGELPEV